MGKDSGSPEFHVRLVHWPSMVSAMLTGEYSAMSYLASELGGTGMHRGQPGKPENYNPSSLAILHFKSFRVWCQQVDTADL
jgi:hypothetical protein